MPADTIVHRLHRRAVDTPEAPAYHVKRGGSWFSADWQQYTHEVDTAARALLALGVSAGEVVGILGSNRPEWVVTALAAMACGGAPAGIYTSSTAVEIRHVLHHSGARVVVVETEGLLARVVEVWSGLPALEHVVVVAGLISPPDPRVITWEAFLARGTEGFADTLRSRMEALTDNTLATLIYTSGTTGAPKGVMLSHHNLAWTADIATKVVKLGAEEHNLSYLPLSHIAEQMFSIHVAVSTGGQIWFAEALEKMPQNLLEVRPTVFFGVPRVWEKFHTRIAARLAEATGLRRVLIGWAQRVASRVHTLQNRGQPLPGWLKLEIDVARRVVFSALHKRLGLDRVKVLVSGAAPIAPDILNFFASLDLPIREVYGQSEGSGPTCFNAPGHTRFGTVGPPVPGVEVTIAPDGEVLLRGPNVFLGYLHDPDATAAALHDGRLHSGDLGTFDADGFLSITGRKKDILITAGGKNIAPRNLEAALKQIPGVGDVVVIGDRRPFLTALFTLDPEALGSLAAEIGVPEAAVAGHPATLRRFQHGVDSVNATVSRVETIKRFAVLPHPFVVGDELTATLKLRRERVVQKYAADIDALYADPPLAL